MYFEVNSSGVTEGGGALNWPEFIFLNYFLALSFCIKILKISLSCSRLVKPLESGELHLNILFSCRLFSERFSVQGHLHRSSPP